MKKLSIVAGIILVSIFLYSFSFWSDCEKENGEIVKKSIPLNDFSKISLHGSSTVYLSQGEEQKVEIETTQNIIDLLNTEVNKEKWTIEFSKCIKSKNGVKFYVTMPNIEEISVSGSGDIIAEEEIESDDLNVSVRGSGDLKLKIKAQKLEASVKGSGDIKISGKTNSQSVSIKGSGDYSAFNLDADKTEVSVNGSGDAKVVAKEKLKANVNGSGDIMYKGSPKEVEQHTNGSGDIEAK